MEVLGIFIILLIILLLYKIINVEKYESIKEPFFTLWVSAEKEYEYNTIYVDCLLYTSPSPRDGLLSRMPSSA